MGDSQIRCVVPDVFIEHVEKCIGIPNDSALPRPMLSESRSMLEIRCMTLPGISSRASSTRL